MTSTERSLLAGWLLAIPESRHDPRPLHELPGGDIIGRGIVALLELWGAVEITDKGIRAVSQSSYYFLHSLAAWAENPGTVILDWSEKMGVDDRQGLKHGVSLVHVLEGERQARHEDAVPIRTTSVAQILIIKAGDTRQFLTQWDERARFFQLIGGRQKSNMGWIEPIFETAIREMEEELHEQVRYSAGDFQLHLLAEFDGQTRLSPTYGALTAYHFTFYRASGLPPLELGPNDRWFTRNDFLAGKNHREEPVRGDHIPLLEKVLGCRIDELPSSFDDTQD